MRTVMKNYDLLTYDELNEEGRTRAINKFIEYLMQENWDFITEWWPEVVKANEKAEQMQTPWFTGEYVWEYAQDKIESALRVDEYLSNGDCWID